jgi:hypothetical protein
MLLSFEEAYLRREQEAILACARAVDSLNETLCCSSLEWGFAPKNLVLFPGVPGRRICGPVEMGMRQHLGLLAEEQQRALPFPPTATD